ncbi:DMT family transporter [Photobacterium kasasachensis]|uniref:DMT family transporter n=1 Tax=Photobacterium kasasachensis TaxID=2910240 RepID=UPI003D0FEC0A
MFTSSWIYLAASELFFVCSVVLLKFSLKLPPTSYIGLAMWLCSVVSFWMFGRAMTFFDLGSLLALFMGIGLLMITLISYFLFNETLSFWKTISIILTVFGVVGLCLTTSSQS